MKKKIVFIMNPISGTVSKANIPGLIDEHLDKQKFDYAIRNTEYAGHAAEIAKEEALNGTDVVVAVGGDGTVNEVARSIIHTNTALGIIPCGSGNGLARHLLIPMNAVKAIKIINECDVRPLDYGIINNYPFFCTCGMGFDAFISQKFAESGKRGPISYAEQILKTGINYKPETYEIEDETGTHQHKAFLITCANACQFGNNAYIAPHASMSDGLLDVIVMEPFDLLEAPQVGFEMFNKILDKNQNIKSFRSKHLTIHRSKPGVIHFDGDPVETGADIEVSLVKAGLYTIVNPFTDRSQREPSKLQNATADLIQEINNVAETIVENANRLQRMSKYIQYKLTKN